MAEILEAEEIWLKKQKRFLPKFHQHIALGALKKEPHKVGDELAGYDIIKTVPEGSVIASEQTVIHYEKFGQ